jgi:hypothetical protein
MVVVKVVVVVVISTRLRKHGDDLAGVGANLHVIIRSKSIQGSTANSKQQQ